MADKDLPNQDVQLQMEPADIRADLAERGRNDLFYFADAVLGYKDLSIDCHAPLARFLESYPSRFKLVLMPRGHFKTTVCSIANTMRMVVRNPNERILLANETTTNAERFLMAIRQHAESNKIFRTLYSDLIPRDTRRSRWSTSELEFVRTWRGPEPTIDTAGMTGAMTSRHYTKLVVDDPISEEATKSEAVMQDTITRIDKIVSLMVKPEEDEFYLIGTRWALHDVYSFFMNRYGDRLARFMRAAIKDGQPIFPELISLDTLAQARTNMGEYMFSCLYMNNPRDVANQDFNIDDLRWWRWSTDEESVVLYGRNDEMKIVPIDKMDITVSVDLAVSEKVTSDRNAIVTCGTTPDGDVVVLDTWVQRCTPLKVIERLIELNERYHPRTVGIEGVAYQKAFKYFLKDECERRMIYMNITELKAVPSKRGTGNNSKEMRIRGLQPIAATGHLYINPSMHELRNEMADFPLGEHDDCIDALAHQLTMWRGLVSAERMARYKESENRLISRIRMEAYGNGPNKVPRHLMPIDKNPPHPDDLGIEIPRFGQIQEWTN